MRKETSSFAPGTEGVFGRGAGGGVVAFLNAASAACRGSCAVRRVLSTAVYTPLLWELDRSVPACAPPMAIVRPKAAPDDAGLEPLRVMGLRPTRQFSRVRHN